MFQYLLKYKHLFHRLLEHRHERREIADHADPVILPAVKHRQDISLNQCFLFRIDECVCRGYANSPLKQIG
jgi:hypothetical protein